MSKENNNHVIQILREVKEGIAPFATSVLKESHDSYQTVLRRYRSEDKGNGRSARKRQKTLSGDEALMGAIDVAGWLKLIDKEWPFFQYKLGDADRAYVNELRLEGRNPASHENDSNDFSDDEVLHIAQTATFLLQAVGAVTLAKNTEKIAQECMKRIIESSVECSEEPDPPEALQQDPIDDPNRRISTQNIPEDSEEVAQVSLIADSISEDDLCEYPELEIDSTTLRDNESHYKGRKDPPHEYIDGRSVVSDYSETPAQVVQRELPRLHELEFEDEDTRENDVKRNLSKRKRSKSNRAKRKSPNNRLSESKRRIPSNSKQRTLSQLRININSNNQLHLLAIAAAGIILMLLVAPELLNGNPYAWLLVLILTPVIYKAHKRWLEHRENMKRMEQPKSLWQRLFGR